MRVLIFYTIFECSFSFFLYHTYRIGYFQSILIVSLFSKYIMAVISYIYIFEKYNSIFPAVLRLLIPFYVRIKIVSCLSVIVHATSYVFSIKRKLNIDRRYFLCAYSLFRYFLYCYILSCVNLRM